MGWLTFLRRWFSGDPPSSSGPTPTSPPARASERPGVPIATSTGKSSAQASEAKRVQPTSRPSHASVVPPKASQVVRPIDGAPTAGLPRSIARPPQQAAPPPPVIEPVTAPSAPATPPPSPAMPTPPAAAIPIKPLNRRMQTIDARLQPHAIQPEAGGRRPSKQRILAEQAARLFSDTLRTRDRQARVLSADEAQLERYGLPLWRTESDVAQALEVSLRTLRHFSMHAAQEQTPHYITFAIPKRRGGERLIMAPKRRLKRLQRRLNALLCAKLPVSDYAHGFRKGHSVRSNAQPHVGKRVVLQLDIHDFFPSIHFGRVRGLLLALGYGFPVASVLAALMTEPPRQPVAVGDALYFPPVGSRACPQGAPTSPQLSNALLMKMDHRLAGLARRMGFAYTRYADDLTFSGDDIAAAHALRILAARIVEDEGFRINPEKTRVARSGSRQSVTGVVVNDVLGLSRQTRRRLRAAIYRLAQRRAAGTSDPAEMARLEGELAYLSMLNQEQARRLVE